MVKIGREIPDFEVGVFHNQEDKKIKLSDYRGKWMVLLFYPKDFTFVCPSEIQAFQEKLDEFKKYLSIPIDVLYEFGIDQTKNLVNKMKSG